MADVHVVPGDDEWAVEVDGVRRDGFKAQTEAIACACRLAVVEGGEIVIHGLNGRGHEPRERPG